MRYVITYEIYVKTNWGILFIFQKCTFSADLFMSVNLIDDRPLAYRQQSIDRQQYGHGSHYTPAYGVEIEHVQRRACLQQLIRQQTYDDVMSVSEKNEFTYSASGEWRS